MKTQKKIKQISVFIFVLSIILFPLLRNLLFPTFEKDEIIYKRDILGRIIEATNSDYKFPDKLYSNSSATPTPFIWETKLRQFNSQREKQLPLEVTHLTDNSLIPMNCNPGDDVISNYRKILSEKYKDSQNTGHTVEEVTVCIPQKGKSVILYSLGPCGGGCSGIQYLGTIDRLTVNEVKKIPGQSAYFGCREPLQMTKNGVFYFRCGGGDGPAGSYSTYKFSLNNSQVTPIEQCQYEIDDFGNQQSRCQ